QRVIDSQDFDAPSRECVRVERDDVVRKELERVQALRAGEPITRCRQPLAKQTDTLPRILMQITYADVEHGAAEDVDERVTGSINRAEDRSHHRGGHARRPQALMCVT